MIKDNILKSFNKRNIVITGGTGLIGRQIVDILCATGAYVKIISLDNIKVNAKAEHVLGDLTDFDFCKQATKGT
ncbi:MAG: NAD-dependent epimerase/dehydratase family protein, partial [Candidatus Omnitrophota bacterium]